jgi:serine protease AprX
LSWHSPLKRAVLAIAVLMAMVLAVLPTTAAADAPLQSAIVRMVDGSIDGAAVIEAVGGTVTGELAIIDGYSAELTADGITALAANPAVHSVTPDGRVALTGWDNAGGNAISVTEAANKIVDADRFWNDGYQGGGVDVALIDSGVSASFGLGGRNVVNGPDLSFESQSDALRHEDTFGHGTHLAGIIAGRDPGAPRNITTKDSSKYFLGMAPDARVVSVKVADRHGIADVSQVIAAIDWVVQHRSDNGLNIRVLNLSFGTDSTQSYLLDPLAYAAEQAWHHGIVVVVAAGNDGNNSALRNPAHDPFVIAVGAVDLNGSSNTKDDGVAAFSNCGTNGRYPDVVAPGTSILSSLASGSTAAVDHPESVFNGDFIVGSGTSQAAAMVSGAAALIISQRPGITPDQVKALLMSTGDTFRGNSKRCQGGGQIDLGAALGAATPSATQGYARSTGTGSLEAARGSYSISHDGVVLEGEQDIMGNAWDGASWSSLSAAGMSWSGGTWNGASWSGASWSGMSWSGMSWSGASWSGMSWSGASWSGMSWSGMSWSGMSWSGDAWLGLSWNGPAGMV